MVAHTALIVENIAAQPGMVSENRIERSTNAGTRHDNFFCRADGFQMCCERYFRHENHPSGNAN